MSPFAPDSMLGYFPVVLPLVMAAAGWGVVRLCRLLALWPRYFVGWKPIFGWQGDFHSHGHWYVDHWSRELFEPLSGLPRIFEYLGPEKIVAHQLSTLRPQIDTLIDEVMNERNAVMWENLPVLVKNRFYLRAHRLLPRIIDDIVEELGDRLGRLLSYQWLLEYAERQQPGTLRRIYDILSQRSFDSISRFCATLGFVVGCLQLLVAVLVQHSSLAYWSLSGALAVFFFFWVCQYWIKYPAKPVRLWRWTLRSPYARFRAQQDAELARVLAESVLSVRNLFNTLLYGGRGHHTQTIIRKRVAVLVEDVNVRTLVQLTVGPTGYLALKQTLTNKLTAAILEPLEEDRFNRARAEAVSAQLQQHLTKLPDPLYYQQLKRILEPLSVIGGIGGFWLGLLAGLLQWLLLQW